MFRRLVSQNKVRFETDSFNLDLSYITQNIIAMGFPSKGFSSTFRNPINEVFSFFEEYHPGHYKIYNLTEEPYHQTEFKGPVEHFPFPDHTAPPFNLLLDIIKSIINWLNQDPLNVVAIHCLAGMGRTGTIISTALIAVGLYENAIEALDHFAQIRTHSDQGVSYPSQQRYVKYFEIHKKICLKYNYEIFNYPLNIKRKIKNFYIEFKNLKIGTKLQLLLYDGKWDPIYNSCWNNNIFEVIDNININFQINSFFNG